jgi:hypothetical protein
LFLGCNWDEFDFGYRRRTYALGLRLRLGCGRWSGCRDGLNNHGYLDNLNRRRRRRRCNRHRRKRRNGGALDLFSNGEKVRHLYSIVRNWEGGSLTAGRSTCSRDRCRIAIASVVREVAGKNVCEERLQEHTLQTLRPMPPLQSPAMCLRGRLPFLR